MMAGWAISVRERVEEGPVAMRAERGVRSWRMWSVCWRKGVQVWGKAASQGAAMPMRWTPWPVGGEWSAEVEERNGWRGARVVG